MRHERRASALILRVRVLGDAQKERHFVYRIASRCSRLPHPRGERRTILSGSYAASPWGCNCSPTSGSRHLSGLLSSLNRHRSSLLNLSCPPALAISAGRDDFPTKVDLDLAKHNILEQIKNIDL